MKLCLHLTYITPHITNRPYSNRKTHDEAIEELKKCSGTQFDPFIAKAFIEVIEENKNNINY